jgi:outer membrane protein assembly factor BamB
MSTAATGEAAPQKPLRLWLGVVAIVLYLLRFVLPTLVPDAVIVGLFGTLLGGLALIVWWAFFSRGPRSERWGAVLLMIAAMFATSRFIDKSIATGMMGFMFGMYAFPVLCIAFAVWAIFSRRLPDVPRRVSMVATILLACGAWTLLRTNGISGDAGSDFAWRWAKTSEERLIEQSGGQASALPANVPAAPAPPAPVTAASAPAKIPVDRVADRIEEPAAVSPTPKAAPKAAKLEANWPGFRGPGRDSIIPGTHIATDWAASPPVKLWRQPIGPGWGSFAVRGDLLYTQEQRGEDEIVACYNAATGKPVWAHRDPARFWESNAGAGPRATPALHDDRLYTLGATGIVNALDADSGAVLWSRNAGSDTGMKVPGWGFAGSPLVLGDMVIVAASGKLVAYDVATGAPRWLGPAGGDSYSSPQLVTIDGVAQILLLSSQGAMSVAPADGSLLWKYAWRSDTRIMQPAVTPDGDFLMTTGDAMGGGSIRRVGVAHGPGGWTPEARWTSTGLKPSFNDSVVYEGHVYGFNGSILACIDLKDGNRNWKGGRYGAGQLVLLRDQGLLLVVSEEGEIALVRAAPEQFTELARFPAIEGKTWNHPVLAGDRLLVRNGNEMAAFRLPSIVR